MENQDFARTLADLLNEILLMGGSGNLLLHEIWCRGNVVSRSTADKLPEDLIARVEDGFVSMSAMGILNTALVRLGGQATNRLIAVVDDDDTLIRFEAAPYGSKPTTGRIKGA